MDKATSVNNEDSAYSVEINSGDMKLKVYEGTVCSMEFTDGTITKFWTMSAPATIKYSSVIEPLFDGLYQMPDMTKQLRTLFYSLCDETEAIESDKMLLGWINAKDYFKTKVFPMVIEEQEKIEEPAGHKVEDCKFIDMTLN